MAKRNLNDSFIRHYSAPDKRVEIYDENTDGLALRVTPTGHKSFVFRYRFGDKVRRYTIGKFPAINLAKAREEARDLSYKVSKGIDPLEEKKKAKEPKSDITFSELAQQFTDKHLPTLRERTRDEYQRIIDKELNPKVGDVFAKEITRRQIIDLLDKIAIGRGKAVFSNRVRAVMSSVYTFGIEKALIESNPVLSVKRKKKTRNGEKVEKRRERTYSRKEIRALWNAFSVQPESVRSVFFMLLICAQRLSETQGMRWSYIDFKKKIWTIPKELTKAKREQVVPLSELAIQVLKDVRSLNIDSEFVFPNRRHNDKPIEWMQSAVYRVQEISKVDDFRIHDLRRTAATFMAQLGVERTTLGKVLNHKGISGDHGVTSIYDRHDYIEEKRQALERWAKELDIILTEETAHE